MARDSSDPSSLTESSPAPERPATCRLRQDLQFHIRDGEQPHVVLEDAARGKYYRLGMTEYRFLAALNGAESLEQALQRQAQRGGESLDAHQAQTLCRWLIQNGLLDTAGPAPGAARGASNWAAWNPFFLRRSLVDPDPLLKRITPRLRWLFSWPSYAVAAAFGLAALVSLAGRFDAFSDSLRQTFTVVRPGVLLIVWCLLKIAHELGHGVVCRMYGGRVRDAGVAFILFAPVAYVDVTSSWRFSSRWKRLHVGLAGIIVELMVAAAAVFVWSFADSAWLRQTAADVVLMASVSTLLFNLNPLMRFDGYYVLADLLGIDNLYQHGQAYARHAGKRWLLGQASAPPRLPARRRALIKLYGVSAAAWRMTVLMGLIGAAAVMFQGAGLLLALLGVAMWIVAPLLKLGRSLRRDAHDHHVSLWRVARRPAILAGIAAAALFLTPTEWTRTAPAIVEYDPPVDVRAEQEGFVDSVHVSDGQFVEAGDLIATLHNERLALELEAEETALAIAEQNARTSQWRNEPGKLELIRSEADALRQRVQELRRRRGLLSVRAPQAGRIVARRIKELQGAFLEAGDEIAEVGLESAKRLKVSLPQNRSAAPAADVVIAAPDLPQWRATLHRIEPRATRQLPHDSLVALGGGGLTVEQTADGGWQLDRPRVNAYISLDEAHSRQLRCGQRCLVVVGNGSVSWGRWLCDWISQRIF